MGGDTAGGVIVVVASGFGDLDIRIELGVARSGGERSVRCLELVDQAERLIPVAAFEVVEGQIGGDIGSVALFLYLGSHFDKDRIEVLALTGVGTPVVETARGLADMVFADQTGLIARLTQEFGKGRDFGIERFDGIGFFGIAVDAVDMRVGTSEYGGPRGSAEGIGAKAVFKARTLCGQAVHIGSRDDPVSVAAQFALGVGIGHDVENIGARYRHRTLFLGD